MAMREVDLRRVPLSVVMTMRLLFPCMALTRLFHSLHHLSVGA